jgi:Flp pilus assembly protein TadG
MRSAISNHWNRRRSGTSILEMMLVFPLLIMLSFGVVDYGYYIYLKNTFQAAAESGARAAIPYAATNSSVTGASGIVTQMMSAAGIPSSKYT